jgi:hypothetical protein
VAKKIRLTEQQQKWYNTLVDVINCNIFEWKGDQDLKECVLGGQYAIFTSDNVLRKRLVMNTLVCAKSRKRGQDIMTYNPGRHFMLVDLESGLVIEERTKIGTSILFYKPEDENNG